MKKFLLSILIGIGFGSYVFFNHGEAIQPQAISPSPQPSQKVHVQTQTQSAQVEEEPNIIKNPEIVSIPRLNVRAAVEHVGLDAANRMDVPKGYQNVAWYELGFAPGETGSAVIAGHFDTPQGTPGVFYGLGTLQPGDNIIVEGEGRKLTYSVIDTRVYRFNQVPLNDVFNSKDKKRLNLITCDGVFDASSANYSNRLIVYAVLEE